MWLDYKVGTRDGSDAGVDEVEGSDTHEDEKAMDQYECRVKMYMKWHAGVW